MTSNYLKKAERWDRISKSANMLMVQANVLSDNNPAYSQEIEYIRRNGTSNFPYRQMRTVPRPESGIDAERGLPYVVHDGKRLYFPATWQAARCENYYVNLVGTECLLGGGWREKAPHQYQTATFRIEDGDVLVDGGSAEGLLALDSIERVGHAYLVEADPVWLPALEATFAPWRDKVTVVNKFLGAEDTPDSVTLASLLGGKLGGYL